MIPINVNTKEDILTLISSLITELESNPSAWTNKTLLSYLEAMQSWIDDMEGFYVNNKLPIPKNISWNIFADILIAAKMYE